MTDNPAPATSTTPATPPTRTSRAPTRTSRAWTGVVAGTVVALLLLIFILENTQSVKVSFLGATGHVSLGVALLLSAVGGALIVGLVGAARMTQLRLRARRAERAAGRHESPPPAGP
ncbi:MAG TPA: lipopolysaccharide assembly protein LapA domain-containing protein [Thermoleophilaceae bacterium]